MSADDVSITELLMRVQEAHASGSRKQMAMVMLDLYAFMAEHCLTIDVSEHIKSWNEVLNE